MVSIIVCTYNREKYLGETLERLAANRYDGAWELVLVNNNSTDTTARICADFEAAHPEISFRYFVETKQGLSHARNRGMAEAKGDWFVFLDDDAFVEHDYLSTLAQYIRVIPNMDAFGGRIYPLFEDGTPPTWLCAWTLVWLSALDKGNRVRIFRGREYPIGANMGFSRRIAEQCGDFNPQLGRCGKNMIGSEEKDYFNRIKTQGGQIYYLPDIAARHCIPHSRTTREYIARLAEGVGLSVRARTTNRLSRLISILAEVAKWGVFGILALFYTLTLRTDCASALLYFRYHVTKALLS